MIYMETLFPVPDYHRAEKYKALAGSMQETINYKLNPAISQQRATARRARIADSMAREGEWLQKIQKTLIALSEAAEAGTIPASLRFVTNRSQVEELLHKKDPDLMSLVGDMELTPEQKRQKEIRAMAGTPL